jgi:hypothetical protein
MQTMRKERLTEVLTNGFPGAVPGFMKGNTGGVAERRDVGGAAAA